MSCCCAFVIQIREQPTSQIIPFETQWRECDHRGLDIRELQVGGLLDTHVVSV